MDHLAENSPKNWAFCRFVLSAEINQSKAKLKFSFTQNEDYIPFAGENICLRFNHEKNLGCSDRTCKRNHICMVCSALSIKSTDSASHGAFSPSCPVQKERTKMAVDGVVMENIKEAFRECKSRLPLNAPMPKPGPPSSSTCWGRLSSPGSASTSSTSSTQLPNDSSFKKPSPAQAAKSTESVASKPAASNSPQLTGKGVQHVADDSSPAKVLKQQSVISNSSSLQPNSTAAVKVHLTASGKFDESKIDDDHDDNDDFMFPAGSKSKHTSHFIAKVGSFKSSNLAQTSKMVSSVANTGPKFSFDSNIAADNDDDDDAQQQLEDSSNRPKCMTFPSCSGCKYSHHPSRFSPLDHLFRTLVSFQKWALQFALIMSEAYESLQANLQLNVPTTGSLALSDYAKAKPFKRESKKCTKPNIQCNFIGSCTNILCEYSHDPSLLSPKSSLFRQHYSLMKWALDPCRKTEWKDCYEDVLRNPLKETAELSLFKDAKAKQMQEQANRAKKEKYEQESKVSQELKQIQSWLQTIEQEDWLKTAAVEPYVKSNAATSLSHFSLILFGSTANFAKAINLTPESGQDRINIITYIHSERIISSVCNDATKKDKKHSVGDCKRCTAGKAAGELLDDFPRDKASLRSLQDITKTYHSQFLERQTREASTQPAESSLLTTISSQLSEQDSTTTTSTLPSGQREAIQCSFNLQAKLSTMEQLPKCTSCLQSSVCYNLTRGGREYNERSFYCAKDAEMFMKRVPPNVFAFICQYDKLIVNELEMCSACPSPAFFCSQHLRDEHEMMDAELKHNIVRQIFFKQRTQKVDFIEPLLISSMPDYPLLAKKILKEVAQPYLHQLYIMAWNETNSVVCKSCQVSHDAFAARQRCLLKELSPSENISTVLKVLKKYEGATLFPKLVTHITAADLATILLNTDRFRSFLQRPLADHISKIRECRNEDEAHVQIMSQDEFTIFFKTMESHLMSIAAFLGLDCKEVDAKLAVAIQPQVPEAEYIKLQRAFRDVQIDSQSFLSHQQRDDLFKANSKKIAEYLCLANRNIEDHPVFSVLLIPKMSKDTLDMSRLECFIRLPWAMIVDLNEEAVFPESTMYDDVFPISNIYRDPYDLVMKIHWGKEAIRYTMQITTLFQFLLDKKLIDTRSTNVVITIIGNQSGIDARHVADVIRSIEPVLTTDTIRKAVKYLPIIGDTSGLNIDDEKLLLSRSVKIVNVSHSSFASEPLISSWVCNPNELRMWLTTFTPRSTLEIYLPSTSSQNAPFNRKRIEALGLEVLMQDCDMKPKYIAPKNLGEADLEQDWDSSSIQLEELHAFLSGKPASWYLFRHRLIARRMKMLQSLVTEIRSINKNKDKNSIVISHHPGAGGTTLARNVLYELRSEFLCILVNYTRELSGSPYLIPLLRDIREKSGFHMLIFLDQDNFSEEIGFSMQSFDQLNRRDFTILRCARSGEEILDSKFAEVFRMNEFVSAADAMEFSRVFDKALESVPRNAYYLVKNVTVPLPEKAFTPGGLIDYTWCKTVAGRKLLQFMPKDDLQLMIGWGFWASEILNLRHLANELSQDSGNLATTIFENQSYTHQVIHFGLLKFVNNEAFYLQAKERVNEFVQRLNEAEKDISKLCVFFALFAPNRQVSHDVCDSILGTAWIRDSKPKLMTMLNFSSQKSTFSIQVPQLAYMMATSLFKLKVDFCKPRFEGTDETRSAVNYKDLGKGILEFLNGLVDKYFGVLIQPVYKDLLRQASDSANQKNLYSKDQMFSRREMLLGLFRKDDNISPQELKDRGFRRYILPGLSDAFCCMSPWHPYLPATAPSGNFSFLLHVLLQATWPANDDVVDLFWKVSTSLADCCTLPHQELSFVVSLLTNTARLTAWASKWDSNEAKATSRLDIAEAVLVYKSCLASQIQIDHQRGQLRHERLKTLCFKRLHDRDNQPLQSAFSSDIALDVYHLAKEALNIMRDAIKREPAYLHPYVGFVQVSTRCFSIFKEFGFHNNKKDFIQALNYPGKFNGKVNPQAFKCFADLCELTSIDACQKYIIIARNHLKFRMRPTPNQRLSLFSKSEGHLERAQDRVYDLIEFTSGAELTLQKAVSFSLSKKDATSSKEHKLESILVVVAQGIEARESNLLFDSVVADGFINLSYLVEDESALTKTMKHKKVDRRVWSMESLNTICQRWLGDKDYPGLSAYMFAVVLEALRVLNGGKGQHATFAKALADHLDMLKVRSRNYLYTNKVRLYLLQQCKISFIPISRFILAETCKEAEVFAKSDDNTYNLRVSSEFPLQRFRGPIFKDRNQFFVKCEEFGQTIAVPWFFKGVSQSQSFKEGDVLEYSLGISNEGFVARFLRVESFEAPPQRFESEDF